jgi:hypothetical protein
VIGFGRGNFIADIDEKRDAWDIIMQKYAGIV